MTGLERLEYVEHELVKIKKNNLRLLLIISIGFSFFLLLKFLDLRVKNEIIANKFKVVDDKGTTRAEFGMVSVSSDSSIFNYEIIPAISLMDERGGYFSGAVFSNNPKEGPVIYLIKNNHTLSISVKDSLQGIQMFKNNKHEMIFGSTTIAGPNIFICDTAGMIFWRAP